MGISEILFNSVNIFIENRKKGLEDLAPGWIVA